MHSLGIVQWDPTRRDHPGYPERVSGSGPVRFTLTIELTFTTDSRGNLVMFVIQKQCDFAFNSMIHFDYRINIHDRFKRESRHVCHSEAM